MTRAHMVFPGLDNRWLRYPRWRATARLPRLPCQPPSMLRENSKTRRALRRVFRKAEDAGIPAYVKDDNAADGVPGRSASAYALVS